VYAEWNFNLNANPLENSGAAKVWLPRMTATLSRVITLSETGSQKESV
jgi:hypothetical protein